MPVHCSCAVTPRAAAIYRSIVFAWVLGENLLQASHTILVPGRTIIVSVTTQEPGESKTFELPDADAREALITPCHHYPHHP